MDINVIPRNWITPPANPVLTAESLSLARNAIAIARPNTTLYPNPRNNVADPMDRMTATTSSLRIEENAPIAPHLKAILVDAAAAHHSATARFKFFILGSSGYSS